MVRPVDVAAVDGVPSQSVSEWWMSGREEYRAPAHSIHQAEEQVPVTKRAKVVGILVLLSEVSKPLLLALVNMSL